jgi:trk system potassium uptake protein TrkH
LSLHSQVALTASAVLIILGTVSIAAMEWNSTLSSLSTSGRILAALFQSINARTAGFNTLQTGTMANETLFFLCILMFIGACPGSCGGGGKTTTIAGLLLMGTCQLRGISRPRIFRRTLTEASLSKAASVAIVSMAVIALAVSRERISRVHYAEENIRIG